MQRWIGYLNDLNLAEMQAKANHPGDSPDILRCPLCPFHKYNVEAATSKKSWKRFFLRHLTNRHKPIASRGPRDLKVKKVPAKRFKNKTTLNFRMRGGGNHRGAANLTNSGAKQFKVLRCLFNADRVLRRCEDHYLEKSARLMRKEYLMILQSFM